MAYRYKVIGTDLKMDGKLYKEGAVLISANKLNSDYLEPIVDEVPKEKPEKKAKKVQDKKDNK